MKKYDRMAVAVIKRNEQIESLIEELKEASLALRDRVIVYLEPPSKDMVQICVPDTNKEKNPRLLASTPAKNCMHGWYLYSQLRINLHPSQRPHLTASLLVNIGAEYDNGQIKFTRLGMDKSPIGEPMSMEMFALDCVDGDLKILQEDPRYQERKNMRFVNTDLLNIEN